ncbi:MAG: CHASE2 domain-containing protein [Nostoc sp. TH1S01]|nr:CHASE2 domain-containing protein [Nostoc sp. TH1S01]
MDLPSLISALAAAAGALITVLRYMQESQKPAEAESPSVNGKFRPLLRWQKFQTAFLASVIIVGLLMGVVRPLGILQPSELMSFDRMMRSRPLEQPDPRLLVVTVNDDDLEYQDQKNMDNRAGSLSDQALQSLLQKLNPHKPRVIGLDIYHGFRINPKFSELGKQLQDNKRLIVTCSVEGTKAPPEIPAEQQEQRLGFSNIPIDEDAVIRRQFLGMAMAADNHCPTQLSFSLQIAQRYLEEEDIAVEQISKENLQIGKVIFPKLVSDTGGYHLGEEAKGHQILLNYRTLKPDESIAQQISLTDILKDAQKDRLPSLVNDRIILIGTTAPRFKDFHKTPYGTEMPGVFIQAHMVSQIISAVLDPRPLLWW